MENLCFKEVGVFTPIIGIIGLFLFYVLCMQVIKRHEREPFSSHVVWRVDFDKVLSLPLKLFCICLTLYFVLSALLSYLGCFSSLEGLKIIRDSMIVLSLSWIATRWKNEVVKGSQSSSFVKTGVALAVNKIVSVCIWILTGLMILRIFHLDVVPLLAFGGIGAAALGFAAKDVIGNFLGGAMISFSQPFVSGEMIFLPDREIEGTVEEVGWCLTSIRDRDKRPVYLPNSLFSQFLVINISRMSHRRIRETLWLRYDDFSKANSILLSVRQFLETNSEIDSKQPVLVYLNRLGEYSLEVYLETYTFETELKKHLIVKEKVLTGILKIIQEMGGQVSYPVTAVKLKQE